MQEPLQEYILRCFKALGISLDISIEIPSGIILGIYPEVALEVPSKILIGISSGIPVGVCPFTPPSVLPETPSGVSPVPSVIKKKISVLLFLLLGFLHNFSVIPVYIFSLWIPLGITLPIVMSMLFPY